MDLQESYTFKLHEGRQFRCVIPYEHTYTTHCKERWRNRPLLDIFLSEFKAYSESYYTESILTGRIQVNLKKVDISYILKNGDTITHKAQRNEPPVLSSPIPVIFDSANFLVVHKPASMPVHPSGAYYKNSMLYIIENELNFKPVYLIHRLDRVTSGIILLAKNSKSASEATQLFQREEMQKYYVARVKGKISTEQFEVNQGIICTDHKNGVYKVHPSGKPSVTRFKVKFYDENRNETVLECMPQTGRTHQIRVHLQHIGHPIANDLVYGGDDMGISVPEVNFKLVIENESVELEQTKCLEIWLCSFRYVLTTNLDFSIPLPDWALPGFNN